MNTQNENYLNPIFDYISFGLGSLEPSIDMDAAVKILYNEYKAVNSSSFFEQKSSVLDKIKNIFKKKHNVDEPWYICNKCITKVKDPIQVRIKGKSGEVNKFFHEDCLDEIVYPILEKYPWEEYIKERV